MAAIACIAGSRTPPDPVLSRLVVRRLAGAFVTAEVGRQRGPGVRMLPLGDWPETMPLDGNGLGLDSLERLGAMGALVEAFEVDGFPSGASPAESVGDWVDWIGSGGDHLTVTTSGSTGLARACRHAIADLRAEAAYFAGLFADRRRIVALVPGHHLYGLIWTILLPDVLGVPVVHGSLGSALKLQPGDLVVAVPEQWQALLRTTRGFPHDLCGVSSAGTLPVLLANAFSAAGVARLIDVYGSSETGAIAWRELPATAYDILPRWHLVQTQSGWQLTDGGGHGVPMPDHIERVSERSLLLAGRRDGAVQVAGYNIWPDRVADQLRHTEGVADITVRLGANGRLKAFVVPRVGTSDEVLAIALERAAADRLSDLERPKAFAFGAALPRNAMGKPMDWS